MANRLIVFLTIAALALALNGCTDYDFDEPDTPSNRKGFERHFGFAVPASVSDLYYFADELGADVKYQMGFKTDQETIDRIASALSLVQKEPESHVRLAREFDWWDQDVTETLTPYWKSNQDDDYYWYLWFNPIQQRAYYIEFSL